MRLFERHAQGIALTAGGASSLEACRPALAQLADADEQARARTTQARGTVVVGVQPVIAQECLTAALPRFAAMYPDIQLDIRYFMRVTECGCSWISRRSSSATSRCSARTTRRRRPGPAG